MFQDIRVGAIGSVCFAFPREQAPNRPRDPILISRQMGGAMRRVVALLVVVVLLCASEAIARTWTTRDGRTRSGTFVRLNGGMVVISRGGRAITIPFMSLCDADQDYVREKTGMPVGGPRRIRPTEDPVGESVEEPDDIPIPYSGEGGGASGSMWGPDPSFDPPSEDDDVDSPIPDWAKGLLVERTWTDVQGRKIQATLVPDERTDGQVSLLKDGKVVHVSRERLSPEDVAYLDEIRQRLETIRPGVDKGQDDTPSAGSPPEGPGGGRKTLPPKKSPFPGWQPSGNSPESSSSPPGDARIPHGGSNPPRGAFPEPPATDIPETPSPEATGSRTSPWPTAPLHRGSPRSTRVPHPLRNTETPPIPEPPPGQQVESYYCTNCNKPLADHIKAGDRCPHCSAYLEYEENADGSKSYSPRYYTRMARLVFWGLVVVGGIVGGIIRRAS